MRFKAINGDAQNGTNNASPNATYFVGDNVSLSNLYQAVKSSVVVIQDLSASSTISSVNLQDIISSKVQDS